MLPKIIALNTFQLTLISIAVIVALLVILLEIILRASESINLSKRNEANSRNIEKQIEECSDLDLAITKLTEQYGHVNSLHTKKIKYQSKDLNFIDGWRATTDWISGATSKVFIFGGSTVQCLEVADHLTICSHLQRLANQALLRYEVQNRGVSGMTVNANCVELLKTPLTKSDIVIVYFGANDSKLDTYFQRAIFPFRFLPGYIKILGGLRIKLRLRVAEWIWLETVKPADRTLKNSQINARNVDDSLTEMYQYVTNAGAKFFALLQPNIFTKKIYTNRDLEIYNRSKINPKIVKLQYNEYLKALGDKEWFHLTTSAIDTHPNTPYLDWCHVNSSGNSLIARSIFDIIKGDFIEK